MSELHDQLSATLGERYSVDRELGGGGMSRVFVVTDRTLDRQIVVKVLPAELAAEVNLQRFRREIQFAAKLQHPHIVPLLSADETCGLPYFTMPFVHGESLRSRLDREGELPIAEAVRILRDVAIAIAYAHEHDVVHRDIKPENVLLSGGTSTVTDFGVAKALSASAGERLHTLTGIGTTVGTPSYMAPEQATADPLIDHRADIYALGLLGYEMLAGKAPFSGRTVQATMAAHIVETAESLSRRRPSVSPELSNLIARCLEKRPADRPQSAADVVRSLDAISVSSGDRTPYAGLVAQKRRPANRMVAYVAAATVVASLAVGFAYYVATLSSSKNAHPMIAVLPFENLGAAGDEYFAEGISEEITGRLSHISGIGVIARGSASHYRNSQKSLPEIARELGANFVLTGTVRWEKSGNLNRVRVSPELVRISDQQSVWSEPYDAELADVFSLQSSIAERVAAALDVKLRPQEKTEIARRPTQNLDAYDCYLRGRVAMSRELRVTRAARAQAIRMMECAVARDPRFTLAHAALSQAYTLSYYFGDDVNPAVLEKANREAGEAIELDPRVVDGHLSLVNYHLARGDAASAKKELSLALEIDSINPDALVALARFRRDSGDMRSSTAAYSRALSLDPRNLDALGELAGNYDFARDYPNAIAAREREIAIAPDNAVSYEANAISHLLWRGDTVAARRQLERGIAAVGLRRMLTFFYPSTLQIMTPEMIQALDTASAATLGRSAVGAYGLKTMFHLNRRNQTRARAYAESTIVAAGSGRGTSLPNWAYRLLLGSAEGVLGHRAEALAHANDVVNQAERSQSVLLLGRGVALRSAVYTLLGDKEKAVDDLERALSIPSFVSVPLLRVDWRYVSLRSNPRFQRLVSTGR